MHQQTLEYGRTPPYRPRHVGKFGRALQLCTILAGLLIAPLWAVFGLVTYPWLQIADGVGHYRPMELASLTAFALAAISTISIALASGVFPGARSRWAVAAVLCIGHAACASQLYQVSDFWSRQTLVSLLGQLLSVGLILLGAQFGLPEKR